MMASATTSVIEQLRALLLQPSVRFIGLSLRQRPVGYGLVQLGLGRRQRSSSDLLLGLALSLRDLRQRLATPQLRPQLIRRNPQRLRGGVKHRLSDAIQTRTAEFPATTTPECAQITGLDTRLEGVGLSLRERTLLHRLVGGAGASTGDSTVELRALDVQRGRQLIQKQAAQRVTGAGCSAGSSRRAG